MVILSAAITTRSGKPILARQFRQMQRSRVEALLASFPKLADTASQHTTVEQDNVRFVYQPLDELYMVLITNRQSNILQDISTLHLFAQVVGSICKSMDEREISRCAFELLSAFDEVVTLGYRENLTPSQIKTFLDMESHEERIQEIIARNKELEASEERKRKAKQLEMQRKEMSRATRVGSGGMGGMPRAPTYPTYTPPASTPSMTDSYDSYNAAKNQSFSKPLATRGKGMQLGKKKTTNTMFEQVRGDLGPESEANAPLAGVPAPSAQPAQSSVPAASISDRDPIHLTVAEAISARLSREGVIESFEVKGGLELRISDASLTQLKLDLALGDTKGATMNTHPKVDKAHYKDYRAIQLTDTSRGFPPNQGIQVMRWRLNAKPDDVTDPPIKFMVWTSELSRGTYNVTVEYELTGSDPLKDVVVTIPYATVSEPSVSSFDAVYEVSGDSIDWTIGDVDDGNNPSGSFEFEAQASSEGDFFPMQVRFAKSRPWVDVDVSGVTLLGVDQEVEFGKEIRSVAEKYEIV